MIAGAADSNQRDLFRSRDSRNVLPGTLRFTDEVTAVLRAEYAMYKIRGQGVHKPRIEERRQPLP